MDGTFVGDVEGEADGPSVALLDFMAQRNFMPPDPWQGYRDMPANAVDIPKRNTSKEDFAAQSGLAVPAMPGAA